MFAHVRVPIDYGSSVQDVNLVDLESLRTERFGQKLCLQGIVPKTHTRYNLSHPCELMLRQKAVEIWELTATKEKELRRADESDVRCP